MSRRANNVAAAAMTMALIYLEVTLHRYVAHLMALSLTVHASLRAVLLTKDSETFIPAAQASQPYVRLFRLPGCSSPVPGQHLAERYGARLNMS